MIKTYLVIPFLKYLIRKEAFFILVPLVRAAIKERRNDGSDSIFHSKPDGKKTILALDSLRYRGDLDALSQNFRVLHLTQRAPGWLIKGFYHEFDIVNYINAPDGSDKKAQYIAASNFMTKFLRVFYSKVSVDCVTTVNFRYTEDHHWVKSSEKNSIPHIILYREGLLAYYRAEYNLFIRAKRFDKFIGSHIIVHNEKCKNIFLKSEFVSKNDISVAGALRMDKLVTRVNNVSRHNKIKKNKQVTLFYFHPNMPMFGVDAKGVTPKALLSHGPKKDLSYAFNAWSGRFDLFYDVHEAIAKLAGVAPLNNESGIKSGTRHIRGGRGHVRKILYMAAIVASRFNQTLKRIFERLIARGKLFKVAIVAVMRKMLCMLNSMVKKNLSWQEFSGLSTQNP